MNGADFDRARCLSLLTSVPIGRVVYTDQALPAVTPVSFVLDGEAVAILTVSGSALAVAVRGAVVAFQADRIDPATLTGWSVTVVGRARLVEVPEDAAGPASRHFIRIATRHVSGGRLA